MAHFCLPLGWNQMIQHVSDKLSIYMDDMWLFVVEFCRIFFPPAPFSPHCVCQLQTERGFMCSKDAVCPPLPHPALYEGRPSSL